MDTFEIDSDKLRTRNRELNLRVLKLAYYLERSAEIIRDKDPENVFLSVLKAELEQIV